MPKKGQCPIMCKNGKQCKNFIVKCTDFSGNPGSYRKCGIHEKPNCTSILWYPQYIFDQASQKDVVRIKTKEELQGLYNKFYSDVWYVVLKYLPLSLILSFCFSELNTLSEVAIEYICKKYFAVIPSVQKFINNATVASNKIQQEPLPQANLKTYIRQYLETSYNHVAHSYDFGQQSRTRSNNSVLKFYIHENFRRLHWELQFTKVDVNDGIIYDLEQFLDVDADFIVTDADVTGGDSEEEVWEDDFIMSGGHDFWDDE